MPGDCIPGKCAMGNGMSPDEQLGYMTFNDWKQLDGERRDYYLWRAIIGRCKECEVQFTAKFEPKRSFAWKTCFLTLIAFSSAAGGFLAMLLGLANTLK